MDTKRAVGLVMAKMALADGEVSDEERGFLAPVLPPGESIDELLQQAKAMTVEDLVREVDSYADKFFIAMRAAAMARIDMDFDAREEAMLSKLLSLFQLSEDDTSLLHRTIEDMEKAHPVPPDPRVEVLFQQSSFVAS